MKIVVLAGGLSTERDVSFKTGDMVAKALRENGHQVILLDVFMGYSDKKEDLTGIFLSNFYFYYIVIFGDMWYNSDRGDYCAYNNIKIKKF